MHRFREIAVLCVSFLSLGACATAAPNAKADMHYQRIQLSPDPVEQPLLTGPPQTAGMRSGRVVLRPGEHMHRHSTEGNEELLVFLQGEAFVLLGMETVSVAAGQVLYIPPQTEHEVHNDGSGDVRYIYVVAPAGR
jgi:mannose-6-phosphate isomerase-like protein (cupin superfamily)